MAASLLVVLDVGKIILAVRFSNVNGDTGVSVLMAALWGYAAYRSYQTLRQLS